MLTLNLNYRTLKFGEDWKEGTREGVEEVVEGEGPTSWGIETALSLLLLLSKSRKSDKKPWKSMTVTGSCCESWSNPSPSSRIVEPLERAPIQRVRQG